MTSRSYTLPLAALSLSLNVSCADPIVGDWELVELDGDEWPVDETYTNDGYSYTVEASSVLTINKELEAELEMDIEIEGEDGYTYDSSYSGDGEVTPGKRGQYDIEIDDDEIELELSCTLDKDELSCEDDDGVDLIFERVDD